MYKFLILLFVAVAAAEWILAKPVDAQEFHDDDDLGPCVPNGVFFPCSPTYAETTDRLNNIVADSNGRVTLASAGLSFQERQLWYAKVGTGPLKYWLIGRLHGNECVNTKPLLDLLEYVAGNGGKPKKIRENLTLIITPIYNPDGSEALTRENAQGIDLNRDWCVNPQPNTTVLPCVSGDSNFVATESNRWFEFYRSEMPDIVLDMHQYQGQPLHPITGKPVDAQVVAFPYNLAGSEQTMFRSLQQGQIIIDSVENEDKVVGRWSITGPDYEPLHSATSRMYADGRRSPTDTPYIPLSSLGIEFRRVCPQYQHKLEDFILEVAKDLVWAAASGEMFDEDNNPQELILMPFVEGRSCTTPCPTY